MDTEIASASYSVYNNKGVYVLFLGSGVSRSAGIPTGWEVILKLIKQIAILNNEECLPTPEEWYKQKFGADPDYSALLEQLTKTQEERVNLLKPFFEPTIEEQEEELKKPTKAHKCVAKLVKQGYVKVIITTNFDRLMENALKDEGIEPVVISNPSNIESSPPLIHNKITVIKVNGDYLDTQFLNIKSELTQYDERMEKLLKFIFENFGLITCGWSAKWDHALVDLIKESKKIRYTNFYTYINKPDEELEKLSVGRKGVLLKTESGNHFFSELFENVDALEQHNMEHPFTPQIAIARLKKYVVREEYKISLHELIHNEVEDTYKKINSLSFDRSSELDINKKIDFLLKATDTLSQLLIHGSYWSKEDQEELWLNSIIRISSPKEQEDTITRPELFENLEYFPGLVLFYSVGLACVRRGKYKLLSKLISLKVYTSKGDESILLKVNIRKVLNPIKVREYIDPPSKLPSSDILFGQLRNHFQAYIPIDREYKDVFDYFEFIVSASFAKIFSGGKWAPMGRDYSGATTKVNGFIPSKIESSHLLKDDFELIKGRLFDNYSDFKNAVDLVEEISKYH